MCIPRAPRTSIFEGQPPKTTPFSNQNKGHLGSRYIYIYTHTGDFFDMKKKTQRKCVVSLFFFPTNCRGLELEDLKAREKSWFSNLCNQAVVFFKPPFISHLLIGHLEEFSSYLSQLSKNFPTYPWNIPKQPPTKGLLKGFLSFGVWGFMGYAPGVCWGSLRVSSQMSYIGLSPLPSNSDHQEKSNIFRIGNPELNLHFHYYW